MNKSLIILLLFVLACHPKEDKTIAFLNDGIENCNSVIGNYNDWYYTDAEVSMAENPNKARPYKILVDSIKVKLWKTLYAIDQRKAEISPSNSSGQKEFATSGSSLENQLGKLDILSCVSDLKNLLESLFSADPIMEQKIGSELNLTKSGLKNYGILELSTLANKVHNLNDFILEYYIRKMKMPKFKSNKLVAAVVTKKRYLHFNDRFEAKIYLLACDTAAKTNIELEGENIDISHGKGEYIDTSTRIEGMISKKGLLKYTDYFHHFPYEFPFTMQYQINNQ
jgi:hypothetical protein